MELYDLMKNISLENNEEKLVESISIVREKLKDLTKERMCKVYSSYLFRELLKNHVPARLVSTLDLGLDYEHIFLLVLKNKIEEGYLLADLTFSQFKKQDDKFDSLSTNGYQLINDIDLNNYLNIVTRQNLIDKFSIEDLFYSTGPSSNTLISK